MQRKHSLTEAVVLVLELEQRVDERGWHWSVIASRAGRDGTFRKTWSNPQGRLAADQATDLAAWASKTLYGALEAWGGIQGTLDGM